MSAHTLKATETESKIGVNEHAFFFSVHGFSPWLMMGDSPSAPARPFRAASRAREPMPANLRKEMTATANCECYPIFSFDEARSESRSPRQRFRTSPPSTTMSRHPFKLATRHQSASSRRPSTVQLDPQPALTAIS
jgi:hypothetical protein